MVEFGNNWDQDKEFDDDLLHLLDFPMECLEGDGLEEDWDMSNSDCLGPIPSNILIGPPSIHNKIMRPPRSLARPIAPIAGTPKPKLLPNHVSASSSHIRESAAFETQSPISVLESSPSCFGGKSLPFKPEKAIPVRSRSKRVRTVGVNPWLLAAPVFSTSQKTSNTKRTKEIKKCLHCESTKTPQWREGPMGPKTLCNACGVRYRSGRLFPEYRPASSPSFVPSKHSNAHKKVIEMRNKAVEPAGIIKIAGAPEEKQLSDHVSSSSMHICQHKSVNIQEPGSFETQNPISILQCSMGEKSQENTIHTNRSKESKFGSVAPVSFHDLSLD